MDRPDDLDWTLLARYLADECTAEERSAVARWTAGAPGRAAELQALRRWWDAAAMLPSAGRVDAMWQSLATRMRAADDGASTAAANAADAGRVARPAAIVPSGAVTAGRRHAPQSLSLGAHRASSARWQRVAVGAVAAGLVLAAGGTYAWKARQASAARQLAAAAAEPAARHFATTRGQRATIRLVDGTRVELSYASHLAVRVFETGRREVELEGEAVFDVVHDPARPFVVRAGNAVTEDLGTVFGVRAYPGDSAVRVVVVSGQVALRPQRRGAAALAAGTDTAGAVLGRGQLGRIDDRGHVDVVSDVDTSEYLGWLTGRVSFHDAALADVAAELGRRFGVTILVPDPAVGAKRITVEMPLGSLSQVLDAVVTPLAIHHHRRADGAVVLER